jgi:hypothetical protein
MAVVREELATQMKRAEKELAARETETAVE